MFCRCGYWATAAKSTWITCPICKMELYVRDKDDQGRLAWGLLHSKKNPTSEWFYNVWLETVPSYDCPCREHFMALLELYPPDFDDFANWAVFIHNQVNLALGKPLWPYSDDA